MSKMNRFQANPFFSVPLIGSLIYCSGNLQEGELTVSGREEEKERKNCELFGLDGHTFPKFCFLYTYMFIYIFTLPPFFMLLISFLFLSGG